MTVLITLTTADIDTGPFDLYSNLDGYKTPFELGVSKAALLAGYSSVLVPDYTVLVRVKSVGLCTNFVDIPVTRPISTPGYEITGCRSGDLFYSDTTYPFTIGEIVYFETVAKIAVYCGTVTGTTTDITPTVVLIGTKPVDCGDVSCGSDIGIS